jgi:hypothetical protein
MPVERAGCTGRFWSRMSRSSPASHTIVGLRGLRPALTPRHGAAAPGVTISALAYLLSLGLVGAATVGAFFGAGLMTAGLGARDRSPPPPETELPGGFTAAVLPISPSLQNPGTQAAMAPETGGSAEDPVPEFSGRMAPLGVAGGALPAAKAPALRSAAHKAKHAPPSLTGPVPRPAARNGTLTPPIQIRPGTLTPPMQIGPGTPTLPPLY